MPDYEVLDSITDELLPGLLELYTAAWWATERKAGDIARMLTASDALVAVVHRPTGTLAAFCRALSDGVYLALILDVVVAADHRGRGLGDLLLRTVLTHPAVATARSVELVCQPELFAFYGRHGFTADVGRSTLMRRARRDGA